MAIDFASALDTRVGDVKKPPTLPQGTYIWSVTKVPSMERNKSGEWDIVEFAVKPTSAEGDVDPDELEAFGNLAMGTNRVSFMFPTALDKDTERLRSQNQLKNFLVKTLRVDGSDNEDSTVRELLAAAVNCQFMAQAVWRQVDDNTYVDVKNWAALD